MWFCLWMLKSHLMKQKHLSVIRCMGEIAPVVGRNKHLPQRAVVRI